MTTDTKVPASDLERRSKAIKEIAAIVTAGGVIVAAMSGSFQSVVDWARGTSQSQSQISAIDERLRLVEEGIVGVEALRTEAVEMAYDLSKQIDEAGRSGIAIDRLQGRLRDLELRVERINALLDALRESRR